MVNYSLTLETAARSFPDKAALVYKGKEISYKQLDNLANRFCNLLKDLDIKEGERVAKVVEAEKATKATRLSRTTRAARTSRIIARMPRLVRLWRLKAFLKKR